MKKFTHKGYTILQETKENHHYMIFDSAGKMRMHVQYRGEIFTDEEAKEIVEIFMRDIEKRR